MLRYMLHSILLSLRQEIHIDIFYMNVSALYQFVATILRNLLDKFGVGNVQDEVASM